MDFTETSEQRELRSVVAAIAGRFGGNYYAERAAVHEPSSELWSALGEAGFIGVNVPEAHGGGGGGLVELAMVCEEISAQGTLLLLVSAAISAEVIASFGTEEQRKEWLPAMANGTSKVVFAVTEPDAGSNTHKLTTTARREGEDWPLRGTKHYIFGVDEADAVLVVARSGGGDTDKTQLSLFIVPTDASGLARTPLPVDAMPPERQFILHFDNVRVRPHTLVGEEGQGFRQVFHGLDPERITSAALCVGIARYALSRAAEHATTRTVCAALMTQKAAWLHNRGLPAGEASNMAKYRAGQQGDDPQLRRPAQPGPAQVLLRCPS